MPILTLVGDDQHAIARFIKSLKAHLNPEFEAFNFHAYPAEDLIDALAEARTPPLGDVLRLIIVENCQFNNNQQFGEKQVEQLGIIKTIPATSTLVLTAASIDRRLKVSKLLAKHGKIEEFTRVDPWKTSEINQSIREEAKKLELQLSSPELEYLTAAIENNTARAYHQLLKLKLYSNSSKVSLESLRQLVPCQTQTSLQLAEAVREGKPEEVSILLDCLLRQVDYPPVITATLCTQFRTWFWVKSALCQGIQNNQDIAKICGVANPGRVYYLRQEVATAPAQKLAQGLTMMFELDIELKQGLAHTAILPRLLSIASLFSPSSIVQSS